MALLQQILYKVNIISVIGAPIIEVNDLDIDSRKVSTGACFVAVKGMQTAMAMPLLTPLLLMEPISYYLRSTT